MQPKGPKFILTTTCVSRENLLQEIHALFSMTGEQRRPLKEQADTAYLEAGLYFTLQNSTKKLSSHSSFLTVYLRLADRIEGGEGRFLYPAQSVCQCAPADCRCSRVPEYIVNAFFLKWDT